MKISLLFLSSNLQEFSNLFKTFDLHRHLKFPFETFG